MLRGHDILISIRIAVYMLFLAAQKWYNIRLLVSSTLSVTNKVLLADCYLLVSFINIICCILDALLIKRKMNDDLE